MPLELTEFARRLCVGAHPLYSTTDAIIPCGQHVQEAQRLWGLTQEVGTSALRTVLEARVEQGHPIPLPKVESSR